jgi:hypothetical protein
MSSTNEKKSIMGSKERITAPRIFSEISNLKEKIQTPRIVNNPVIKLRTFIAVTGVALKYRNGIKSHASRGPQYPFTAFEKSPLKYFSARSRYMVESADNLS